MTRTVILFGAVIAAATLSACGGSPARSTSTSTTTKASTQLSGFSSLAGTMLPRLPSSNWPALTSDPSTAALAGAQEDLTTSSNDITYEVNIFKFASNGLARAFYDNEQSSIGFAVLALGEAAIPLAESTGISSAEAFNLIECGGDSSVEPGNKCSGNTSKPFSGGVITVFRRGLIVATVTYYSGSIVDGTPPSSELAKNVKVSNSILSLLRSAGIG